MAIQKIKHLFLKFRQTDATNQRQIQIAPRVQTDAGVTGSVGKWLRLPENGMNIHSGIIIVLMSDVLTKKC